MQGRFDFDYQGMATVLSAPSWTRAALVQVQGEVRDLADVVNDPKYSDSFVNTMIDQAVGRLAAENSALAQELAELKGKPRSAVARYLYGVLAVLGTITTVHDGVDITREYVEALLRQAFG